MPKTEDKLMKFQNNIYSKEQLFSTSHSGNNSSSMYSERFVRLL